MVIELGTDCDDTNKLVSPAGWDGPAGAGKPNACDDGVDQDCSGVADDGKLPNGTTCTCSPNDVADCATDAGGKPIDFPGGKPVGLCKLGKKTCNAGGTWGPCIGAVGPAQETCDKQDNDCNGKVDDAPIDGVYWVYDGDDDGRGAKSCAKVYACKDDKPTTAPAGCGAGTCPTCAPGAWKLASAIPADDCDDNDASVNPLGKELCGDAKDSDCDGAPDNGCPCLNGQTQSCWSGTPGAVFEDDPGSKSTCKRGTQSCDLSGKWGECTGQTFPTAEQCNGLDDNCDGAVDDGFDLGAVCNVNNSVVGACKGGGARACGSGGLAVCAPAYPGIGENQLQTLPQPNDPYQFDWNCDGSTTYQYTSQDWDIYPATSDTCSVQTICEQQPTQAACNHQGLLKPWLLNCDFHFNETSPYCGNTMLFTGAKCEWVGGKCQAPTLGAPLVQHTQGCY